MNIAVVQLDWSTGSVPSLFGEAVCCGTWLSSAARPGQPLPTPRDDPRPDRVFDCGRIGSGRQLASGGGMRWRRVSIASRSKPATRVVTISRVIRRAKPAHTEFSSHNQEWTYAGY